MGLYVHMPPMNNCKTGPVTFFSDFPDMTQCEYQEEHAEKKCEGACYDLVRFIVGTGIWNFWVCHCREGVGMGWDGMGWDGMLKWGISKVLVNKRNSGPEGNHESRANIKIGRSKHGAIPMEEMEGAIGHAVAPCQGGPGW